MKNSLALQLYSLRRETALDPEATLRRVPSLGFDSVELAGTYGWPADQWKALLAETNLTVAGAHTGLEALQKQWTTHAGFAAAIGHTRLIVPWLAESFRTPEGYRAAAGQLNELGRRAQAEGLALLYHNHAFEFDRLADGSCGMEILLRETDPAVLRFEIDTYWVERAGRDCAAFIDQHAARIGMIHAKDLRKRDNANVPAGQGDVDFRAIVPWARQNGWPIVVEYEGDNALQAVTESARYLQTLQPRLE